MIAQPQLRLNQLQLHYTPHTALIPDHIHPTIDRERAAVRPAGGKAAFGQLDLLRGGIAGVNGTAVIVLDAEIPGLWFFGDGVGEGAVDQDQGILSVLQYIGQEWLEDEGLRGK